MAFCSPIAASRFRDARSTAAPWKCSVVPFASNVDVPMSRSMLQKLTIATLLPQNVGLVVQLPESGPLNSKPMGDGAGGGGAGPEGGLASSAQSAGLMQKPMPGEVGPSRITHLVGSLDPAYAVTVAGAPARARSCTMIARQSTLAAEINGPPLCH